MGRNRRRHGGASGRAADRQAGPPWWQLACFAGALATLGAVHLASVVSDFRLVAGLHRWLITYAEGFHRRGLFGTVFQALVGHEPRDSQIALASLVSATGTWLWAAAALFLMTFAAWRTRNRLLVSATLAYAAFAVLNPMWTSRAHDNGYLDWLVGLVVTGALAAYAYRRHMLSGAIVAVGIVAYWGTVFIWLALGFLIACLLLRDVIHGAANSSLGDRVVAACRRREVSTVLLPVAAALTTALLNDNDAAISELNRVGNQDNIIRETFIGVPEAVSRQVDTLLRNWRAYLAVGAVYVVPPALCAALWTGVMRRFGRSLFRPAWLDTAAAVVATSSPLTFLLVAFDLSRLMAWTYFAFIVVAVFWLFEADTEPGARPGRIWPWATVPVVLAGLFLTSPTIYAWADFGYLVPCERFCFKERTPHGTALDRYRRGMIASPTLEYTSVGGFVPGTTGHIEEWPGNRLHRVAREGRDDPGDLMDVNIRLPVPREGVTVGAPAQTKNAIIGSGPHRLSIAYRATGTETANAETRLTIYNSALQGATEVLRAPLKRRETRFDAVVTAPAELSGNPFRWQIVYSGEGAFDLREVSFVRQSPKG